MTVRMNYAPKRHMISQVFVFVLLGVFVVLSVFMVLICARLYRGIVTDADNNASLRILTRFITNSVHSNDSAGMIYTEERNGIDVLVLSWDVEGEIYETLIYCYDGMICELYKAASQEFEPDYGETICRAKMLTAQVQEGLLHVKITDECDNDVVVDIALRAGGR